ncbi:MAG: ABC transporter permease [Candidatus Velthaea sp.]|jgi:ribose/xylose/arabinose/galactoside ABC-type transport system permease subunit
MTQSPPPVAEVTAVLDARAGDARHKAQRGQWFRLGLAIAGFVALVIVVNAYTHGDFLTVGNVRNVLRQITFNCVSAVGETFVIITAGIDLSVGSIMGLAGVVMALFANAVPLDNGPLLVTVTAVVGLAVGALAGYINAVPVVRLNLPPFITTLAMMQIARGLAFILAHGQPIPLATSAFNGLGTGELFGQIPYAIVLMLVVVAVFSVVLTRTRFGRYTFALGGNEEAARLAGINTRRTKTLVYVISGALAALAGLLLMSRFSSGSPQTGLGYELSVIAAVVVGGTSLMGGRGAIVGTFFGALLIGVLNNVMNLLNIESYTQQIVLGAVILLAVIVDELRKRFLAR